MTKNKMKATVKAKSCWRANPRMADATELVIERDDNAIEYGRSAIATHIFTEFLNKGNVTTSQAEEYANVAVEMADLLLNALKKNEK